jgi:hypothetical protein
MEAEAVHVHAHALVAPVPVREEVANSYYTDFLDEEWLDINLTPVEVEDVPEF